MKIGSRIKQVIAKIKRV